MHEPARRSARRAGAASTAALALVLAGAAVLLGLVPHGSVDGAGAKPSLPKPAASALKIALRQPCIDFTRRPARAPQTAASEPTEAFSSDAQDAGATLILAAASEAGSAKARSAVRRSILQLIDPKRHCRVDVFRTPSSEPTASGGTTAQHELWATGMIAIARHDRPLWRSFSRYQRKRIDLIMRGSLISNAFVMSDHNPLLMPDRQRLIDGTTNVGRDWGPNYREGMLGQVLAGIAYFGERGAADELATWDRARFLRDVRRRGLRNLEATFAWGQTHPTAGVPTDDEVRAALTNWSYRGFGLDHPMELWALLTRNTYALPVDCGLEGGQGTPVPGGGRAGRLADPAQCNQLALGAPGMLREFDTTDAGGPRSSLNYAYMGFKANLANQVVLLAAGLWKPGPVAISPATDTAALLALRATGIDDLWRKLRLGYVSYANGKPMLPPGAPAGTTVLSLAQPAAYGQGFTLTRALLDSVANPAIAKLERKAAAASTTPSR